MRLTWDKAGEMLSNKQDIWQAVHWWCSEREALRGQGVPAREYILASLNMVRRIVPFLYQAIDSLYIATRGIPSPWTSSRGLSLRSAGTRGLYINEDLSPEKYLLLRTVIGLASDVYFGALTLKERGNLKELEHPVERLYQSANRFRDVRNFFTHLDGVLSKPDRHGISGAFRTSCGIEYTDRARECEHFVLVGDRLHFTYRRNKRDMSPAKELDVGKSAFNCVFEAARLMYAELTSHKLHADACYHCPPNELYRL